MKIYALLVLIAISVTYLLTPVIRRFAIKTGAISSLRKRDIHTRPTPRLGGAAVLSGFLFTMVVAYQFSFLRPVFEMDNQLIHICIGAVLICLVGALDDYFDLDWLLKLALQIGVAAYVSWQGVRILTLPIAGLTVTSVRTSFVLTVLIIVAVMNAINFIDGLDGLSAGIVAIAAGSFFVYCYLLSSAMTTYASAGALISAILCGSCIGFLPHNFYPARIFIGDSGSMLLGYFMACSAIIVTGRIAPGATLFRSLPVFMPILLPFLVLLFPAVDMVMSIFRRLIHGHSPFQPDQMHIHHRMMLIGHSQVWAVTVLYLWSLLVGAGSVMMLIFDAQYVLFALGIALVLMLLVTFGPLIVGHFRKKAHENQH
ncbi:MAG: undecaprenyl/decaprenyl-phosphate alpha-N-acetylglucosaminyl 1-phosphate transferase [Bifidobacteriaceae bacterium]|nr:undecaprenyl/decaprenyl-phosphate alpha-N-acetylglucosaminyl 1-phosphate transferase [Bifidobacteriaceae bacterium]